MKNKNYLAQIVNKEKKATMSDKECPIVEITDLKKLLKNDEITLKQFKGLKNADPIDRAWFLCFTYDANRLYDCIKNINDEKVLNEIVEELIGYSNNHALIGSTPLPKPLDDYHPASREIIALLEKQNHSGAGYFETLYNFINVVAERKKITYTPKSDLFNNSVLKAGTIEEYCAENK